MEQPPQEKAPHPALMSFSSFSSCATFVAHVTFSSAHVAAHSTRVTQVTFSSCTFKLTRRLCIILNKCLHWPIFKFLHWPISCLIHTFSVLCHLTISRVSLLLLLSHSCHFTCFCQKSVIDLANVQNAPIKYASKNWQANLTKIRASRPV